MLLKNVLQTECNNYGVTWKQTVLAFRHCGWLLLISHYLGICQVSSIQVLTHCFPHLQLWWTQQLVTRFSRVADEKLSKLNLRSASVRNETIAAATSSRCNILIWNKLLLVTCIWISPQSQSRKEMWLTGEKYDW